MIRIHTVCLLLVVGLPSLAASQDLTLSRMWPNADGTQWTYSQLHQDLNEVQENTVRLFFHGTVPVPSGPVAQQLVEWPVVGATMSASGAPSALLDPFLRQLWLARPDLRAEIERRFVDGHATNSAPTFKTVLLGGGAWEKTADVIRTWRTNTENRVAWISLVSDLTVGTQFDLQLVPDLADDVFLYGTIAATEDVTVPAGTFEGALRVDYRIDYGISFCVDIEGTLLGSTRAETAGSVHYAADVGPARVFEEYFPAKEMVSGNCPGVDGEAISSTILELMSTETVAVEKLTWAAVKSLYRGLPRRSP